MAKNNRKFGGKKFTNDSRHGEKPAAILRAEMLREDGKHARITHEREDYGWWYIVWVR